MTTAERPTTLGKPTRRVLSVTFFSDQNDAWIREQIMNVLGETAVVSIRDLHEEGPPGANQEVP